jgi:hypothetical protein
MIDEKYNLIDGPFVLSCIHCDNGDGIGSRHEAAGLGWDYLQADNGGLSWTWLGLCPSCVNEGVELPDGCFDEAVRENGLVVACCCLAGAGLAVLTIVGIYLGVIG